MRAVRGARIAGTVILGATLLVSGGCGYKNMPVPPESVVPEPIEDLRYTLSDDSVQLSWTYPVETIKGTDILDVSSFELYRSEIALEDYCKSCPVPYGQPIEVPGGMTTEEGQLRTATYEDGGLRSGHKYFYKVQSRTNWWAASDDSNIVTFVLYDQPASPTGLKAVAGESQVNLGWQPVTTLRDGSQVEGEVEYQVLRSSGGEFTPLGKTVDTPRYIDSNLKNGQQYQYRVQSMLRFGTDMVAGGISDTVLATPKDRTPPPPPTGVSAIRSGSTVKVVWDSTMDEDTAGFRIYRRAASNTIYKEVATVEQPVTIYVDSEVEKGVRYYYAVTAVDGSEPPNESIKSRDVTTRD